jgi:nucleoside-diphosphate kinase
MKRPLIFIFFGICITLLIAVAGYRWYIKKFGRSNQIERTLAIIKPDAVKAHATGKIIDRIEQEGFTVLDLRKVQLEREQAEKFYAAHKDKKFFHQLVDYMISGPIVVIILEKLNAIPDWRSLMGDTDPVKAKAGTIRKQFGTDIGKNAVHGSDSTEAATKEIRFFFADRGK